jgi:tetratricopeptide (TPR) repeat protein
MTTGRGAEAIQELRLAVQDHPDAKYALGAALQATGQVDEAITVLADFVEARATGAEQLPARTLLANALISARRFAEASTQLRAVLAIMPGDRKARTRLADLLLAEARYAEAAAEYKRAMTDGTSLELELGLGAALKGAGQPAVARTHFERALALDARSAEAHRHLAEMAWERSDAAAAVTHANAALGIDPRHAGTHNFLGVVLASSDRLSEAIDHFREALRLEPSNDRARQNLERAERESSR